MVNITFLIFIKLIKRFNISIHYQFKKNIYTSYTPVISLVITLVISLALVVSLVIKLVITLITSLMLIVYIYIYIYLPLSRCGHSWSF